MIPTDWQTLTVTFIALVAMCVLVRALLPARSGKRSEAPACGSCASGSAACAKPGAKAPPKLVEILRNPR